MEEGFCMGVFDGHGGEECAEAAVNLFPGMLADAIGEPGITVPDALRQAFERLNEQTQDMSSGCTASIAVISPKADTAHVAVLGDSPIIIKRADKSIWIAPDHNVRTNAAEALDAQARGGVVFNGYLYAQNRFGDNAQGLQMARALGDKFLGKVLLRTPEISSHPLGRGSFVLVCSDGALDPGHKNTDGAAQEVIKLIQKGKGVRAIVNHAVKAPTGDNVTALLVRVRDVRKT
jgi:serine/threonine protein phosphatase PrpC